MKRSKKLQDLYTIEQIKELILESHPEEDNTDSIVSVVISSFMDKVKVKDEDGIEIILYKINENKLNSYHEILKKEESETFIVF